MKSTVNRNYLGLLGATLLWASVFHIGKFALSAYSPLAIVTARYGVAALILLGMFLPEIRSNWRMVKSHWQILSVLALSGVVGFGLCIFYGLQLTSPVNAALIMAFNPSLIIVASAAINRERITLQQIAGLALALGGVLIVVTHGSFDALIHLNFSKGDALIGLATLCWTVYCVLPKRYARELPSSLLSSTTIILAALMLVVIATGAASASPSATDSSSMAFPGWAMSSSILFLGLFGTVIPYLWWNRGVQTLGPAKAGVFMNLVPIFASLMGVALGQHLLASQIAGAAFVIGGVLITSIKLQLRQGPVLGRRLG